MEKSQNISPELKDLVSQSVKLLGQAIKDVYGEKTYKSIESLRLKMKSVRAENADTVSEALESVYKKLATEKSDELHRSAKAFSLMLELINSCEAAYRSFRLDDLKISTSSHPHSLVFVFTSHPTEARSRDFLFITDKIEVLLLESLKNSFSSVRDQLLYLMKLSLRIDLANSRRPEVKDEAEQIFHTVLSEGILEEQISLKKKGIEVYFRTWVGGDKDGHPLVGPVTMLQSFNLSRERLLSFVDKRLSDYFNDIVIVDKGGEISKVLRELRTICRSLKKVGANDGLKIKKLRAKLTLLNKKAASRELSAPQIVDLDHLLWLYPSLVLPLEIREDHELIHQALKDHKQPIYKMLTLLKKISKGLDAKWYVRGFVISMCQSSEDVLAAIKLTKKCCGSLVLPVVPLFENEKGLNSSIDILSETFRKFDLKEIHKNKWGGRFEVMLGYSDSSKENGVLPGRLMVEKAILNLEKFILKEKLTPVFFHGSGGSVSRGGGSIKEQIAWLPQTALNIYKVTVQGETVQRQFHQPLILRSQVGKIVEEFSNYKKRNNDKCPEMEKFAKDVLNKYRTLVNDSDFQQLASLATPYDFLNLLKIGSRPTKRAGKGKFTLRAIPWILCWTQVRLLLPMWWGVGSSWQALSNNEKIRIKEHFSRSPLLQSYLKNLGFTLAKIELGVWKFQLSHTSLSSEDKNFWFKKMESEILDTQEFFSELTGGEENTWFNKRLGQSIYFRSSMIHPLNVIQRISLERKDNTLLRETVTGIACGMLTTG